MYGFVDSTVGLCISLELLGDGVYPGRPTRKDSGMSSAPLCDPSILRLPPPDLKDAGKPSFATCSDSQADCLSGTADGIYGLLCRELSSVVPGGASAVVGVA
jgi:hypothetical protein